MKVEKDRRDKRIGTRYFSKRQQKRNREINIKDRKERK